MNQWEYLFLEYCKPECPPESNRAGEWLASKSDGIEPEKIISKIVHENWHSRKTEATRRIAQSYLVAQAGDRTVQRIQSNNALFNTATRMLGDINVALDSIPKKFKNLDDGKLQKIIEGEQLPRAVSMLMKLSVTLARVQHVHRTALGYYDEAGVESMEDLMDNTFEIVLKKEDGENSFSFASLPERDEE
jgi:hypothetical protein